MGVIEGFTVQIDESALLDGAPLDAMVILKTEPSQTDDVYRTMLGSEARYVIKTADSKVLVHFKGSGETFENHVLGRIPDGVKSYRTIVVTDEASTPPTL
ncbi:MAG: hypothetical protein MAG715_00684 [Methanonatronarchaeales archaeon]|nr:hypothetical protein [Methanonatronarchaeales archaeon]